MSAAGLQHATDRMRRAGMPELAVDVFAHYYAQLEEGRTGLIPEDSIEPVLDVTDIAEVEVSPEQQREALARTVMIKLNGGLGTSMGMDRAKSLLPVRDGLSFLDIIAGQVRHTRATSGVDLPLLLMDSFRTRDDSLAALAAHPDLVHEGLPLDFVQHREPKLLVDSLEPADWPADPSLEWCPPGHGDIYVALLTTGLLDELISRGYRYANTSNADNLGAAPDGRIAGWFAASGAPYAPEVCRRTPADRKGGHLGRRRADGRMILRDTAQTPEADMRWFTDEHRHPYFHTNNLWFDLVALRDALTARGGIPGLPLIRNRKHVDPTDPSSPEVYQVECALGAVVELFDDPAPVLVERARFLPVKTTDDLMLLRSDAYDLGEDFRLRLVSEQACLVRLDPAHYRRIADFEARFPAGVPSLRTATRLTVEGDWTFGAGVVATGDVRLPDPDGPRTVPDGSDLAAFAAGLRGRPTGRQFAIALGDQRAVVTERGAALRSYRVGDRDVVVAFGEDEPSPAMHGAILLPWPNRLADGRYVFDGVTHEVPINEPDRRVANHGLVHGLEWRQVEHADSAVELGLDLLPRPGYPFHLDVRIRYGLSASGLAVELSATNVGTDRAPYGVGFHPWLSPGAASVDECRLQVDATTWLRADERLLPVATEAIPPQKDFSAERQVGRTSLDDGFGSATFRDGLSWARLTAPDGTTAAAWMEPPLGYWQVCTGDFPETGRYERTGVATEPMSCPANAFVSGQDLAVIEPGATHVVRWGLRLEDAA